MKNTIVFAEILISIQYQLLNDEVIQKFVFNKREKASKYIKDHRYLLYDKFEAKIREEALSIKLIGLLEFIERIDLDDEVIIKYRIINNLESIPQLKQENFKLVDFVPPYPGCSFCIHKIETEGNFFKCNLKNKFFSEDIKNCKFFKQKRLFKT